MRIVSSSGRTIDRAPDVALDPLGVGREQLEADAVGRHPAFLERLAAQRDELERAAEEPLGHGLGTDEHVEHGVELRGVDAPGEQGRRALLAREHVVQGEARRVAVLQVGELLEEHHVERRPVRVDEREARGVARGQHVVGERHQRRDAGSGGDADQVRAVEVGERGRERALRAHHVDPVARVQFAVRPGREAAAEVALDADADAAGGRRPADRVAAPQLVAVDGRAQGDVLAGEVVVLVVQLGRHGEGHLDAVGRQRPHLGDLELVEARAAADADPGAAHGYSTLKKSNGSRQARHS